MKHKRSSRSHFRMRIYFNFQISLKWAETITISLKFSNLNLLLSRDRSYTRLSLNVDSQVELTNAQNMQRCYENQVSFIFASQHHYQQSRNSHDQIHRQTNFSQLYDVSSEMSQLYEISLTQNFVITVVAVFDSFYSFSQDFLLEFMSQEARESSRMRDVFVKNERNLLSSQQRQNRMSFISQAQMSLNQSMFQQRRVSQQMNSSHVFSVLTAMNRNVQRSVTTQFISQQQQNQSLKNVDDAKKESSIRVNAKQFHTQITTRIDILRWFSTAELRIDRYSTSNQTFWLIRLIDILHQFKHFVCH